MVMLCGCNDFLDSEDLTKKDNSNFPKTETDAGQSLAGCYNMLRYEGDNKIGQNLMIVSELLSDDRFGGGGGQCLGLCVDERHRIPSSDRVQQSLQHRD